MALGLRLEPCCRGDPQCSRGGLKLHSCPQVCSLTFSRPLRTFKRPKVQLPPPLPPLLGSVIRRFMHYC